MRFTAKYEEEIPELDYSHKAESNSLSELVYKLESIGANDYHMIVVEWQEEEPEDSYGAESRASARMFEIEPWMDDLSRFEV